MLVTRRVTLVVFQWLYTQDFEPVLRYYSGHFFKLQKGHTNKFWNIEIWQI